ncbi:hypothetical protein Tco_1515541 [Tanacetum coccineum]
MDLNFTNENDPWEYNFDIDDSDLNLTPVLRSSSSARVEPSPYTPNPVRIIPGSAGTVQVSSSTCFEPSSSTPNPVRIIPGPAGGLTEDELHQLAKDEETLKEVLEEEAKREKENAIYNKRLEEYWKEEQAHDELFRIEFRVKSDSEYKTD